MNKIPVDISSDELNDDNNLEIDEIFISDDDSRDETYCPKALSEKSQINTRHKLNNIDLSEQSSMVETRNSPKLSIPKKSRIENQINTTGIFVCDYCGDSFVTKTLLRSHIVSHKKFDMKLTADKNVSIVCYYCDRSFFKESNLVHHTMSMHTKLLNCKKLMDLMKNYKTKPYPCEYCNKVFDRKDYVVNHMVTLHAKLLNFKQTLQTTCSYCYTPYDSVKSLTVHIISHIKSSSKPPEKFENGKWTCNVCSKVFYNEHQLTYHGKLHTKEKRFEEKCKICLLPFKNKSSLLIHMRVHNSNVYQCDMCSRKFFIKGNLEDHLQMHIDRNKSNLTTLKPSYVEDSSSSKSSELPSRRESSADDDLYLCEVCLDQFPDKKSLDQHADVHIRKDIYKCNICLMTFTLQSDRTLHCRSHVESNQMRCEICLESFATVRELYSHVKDHMHEKPYQCELCSKAYALKNQLNKHKLFHTTNVPDEDSINSNSITSVSIAQQYSTL